MKPIKVNRPPLEAIRNRNLETRRMKASELLRNPKNARVHPDTQASVLRGVLSEVGLVGTLIGVDTPQGTLLLDGHLRSETVGDAEVDVTIVDLTPAEQAKILAAYDQIAGLAELDPNLLDSLLRDIETGDEDLAAMLNDMAEEAGILDEPEPESTPDDPAPQTDAEKLLAKWGAARGQLWIISSEDGARHHRLLCGDSTEPLAVRGCLAGGKFDVVVLDPPFELDDRKWTMHIHDPCIVFGQAKHIRAIPANLWRFERIIDKVKKHRGATVHIGHRHAFVAQCGTTKTCPKTKDTFDSIATHEWDGDFDYCKPVALLVEHLTNWTPPWKVAFDPFMGSGSTLLAAERMGRVCCGIELDPGRVAICLERFTEAGLTPQLEPAAPGIP